MMNLSSWLAALRLARRDALRHKGRSALVVAMIALPVLGVTMADVLARSAHLTPLEKLNRELGAASATLRLNDCAPFMQSPNGSRIVATESCRPLPTPPDVAALLPPGSRVVGSTSGMLNARDVDGGVVVLAAQELRYDDPIVTGLIRQVSGRAPASSSEIALSTSQARELHLRVGDTLRTVDPDRSYTVVGTVQRTSRLHDKFAIALPDALVMNGADTTYFTSIPGGLSWGDVMALNNQGVAATSRDVVLHPPADEEIPLYRTYGHFGSSPLSKQTRIALIVVAGMALLEVVLLAGPAFAVGARRMSRQLALVAASGGERRHIRDIVLAGGAVLGLIGGLTGAVGGVLLALVSRPVITNHTGTPFGSLHFHPLDVAAVTTLGVVTGLLAALLPARAVARQDVVAALSGRRGVVRTPRRMPLIGVLMFGLGLLLASRGATRHDASGVLLGAIVAELALVTASAAIVGMVGRLSSRLPTAPRMAVRDAARNRARTAPAVSAIMAAVAGSVAVDVYLASSDAQHGRMYQPSLRLGQAELTLDANAPNPERAQAVEDAMRRTLGAASVVQAAIRDTDQVMVEVPLENQCTPDLANVRDWRCDGRGRAHIVIANVAIGEAKALHTLTGATDGAAVAALADGKAIVFDRQFVGADNTVLLADAARLPAVLVAAPLSVAAVLVSPATAAKLGLTARPVAVVSDPSGTPTKAQEGAARKAIAATGSTAPLYVERGYHATSGVYALTLLGAAGLVTLGASGVVSGLTTADSRADHATLAAIGANPRTRRVLAMSSSGLTAFLGALLGIVAGFVPAIGVWRATRGNLHVTVPWAHLALLAIVLPSLAALSAGLFTRSKLPMPRRLA